MPHVQQFLSSRKILAFRAEGFGGAGFLLG
jgi:hypothetical protein